MGEPNRQRSKRNDYKRHPSARAMERERKEKEAEREKKKDLKRISRAGLDLVVLFYGLMILILFFGTCQAIGYHIGLYGKESFLYPFFTPIFQSLGVNYDAPLFRLQFFTLPLNLLIDTTMLYTLGYGGFEGTTSLIKSMTLPQGQSAPMPEYKLKRFFRFIIAWFIVTLIFSTYQMVLKIEDTKVVSFFVNNVFVGFGTSCVAYLYGRQAPKVTEGVGTVAVITPVTTPEPTIVPPTAPVTPSVTLPPATQMNVGK